MNLISKITRYKKRILIIILVAPLILYCCLYPNIMYLIHKGELNKIAEQITIDNQIQAYKDKTVCYYRGGEPIKGDEIDKTLKLDLDSLLKDNEIVYIGWGCYLGDYFFGDYVFVRLYNGNNKPMYLMYSPNAELHDVFYEEKDLIQLFGIADNWYCFVINDIDKFSTAISWLPLRESSVHSKTVSE